MLSPQPWLCLYHPATGPGFLVPPPLPELEGTPLPLPHMVVAGDLSNHQRSQRTWSRSWRINCPWNESWLMGKKKMEGTQVNKFPSLHPMNDSISPLANPQRSFLQSDLTHHEGVSNLVICHFSLLHRVLSWFPYFHILIVLGLYLPCGRYQTLVFSRTKTKPVPFFFRIRDTEPG